MTEILTRPDELEETHLESEIPCGRKRWQGWACQRVAEWRMILDCEVCGRVSIPVCSPCLIYVKRLAKQTTESGKPRLHSLKCQSPAVYVAAVKL